MPLYRLLTMCVFLFLYSASPAQHNYWIESFENTSIPGNSGTIISTPTNISLPTSGTWNMYYVYRGGAVCGGKPLRLVKNTTAGISVNAFAITPTFLYGIGQIAFLETSAAVRSLNIYKSTDNGATWSLLQSVTTSGAACAKNTFTINDSAINKLKFTNETAVDVNIDSLVVSKNGTLIDVPASGPVDTTAWYVDTVYHLPAFPGAEGAGKYTRGGRGGEVVEVTNLLDDVNGNTVGSFRWAQKKNNGPKTIVFRVSGTIHLQDALSIARGDVTIAGQTAPGDGITLADFPVTFGKQNVILRYLRFRLGDVGITRTGYASSSGDAVNSSGGNSADSMIIDHCTSSWSIDEAATFKNMTHFTMQNCLISEPLNQSDHGGELHGYGGIWGGVNASFHHNLFAHCSNRNCRFNGSRQYTNGEVDTVDYRNNVIYDWVINTVYGGEGGCYNVVNNYYKPGPSTDTNVIFRTLNPYQNATLAYGKYYMTGNYMASSAAITNNNWLGVKMEDGATPLADTGLSKNTYQIKAHPVTTFTAQQTYDYVLKNAGAIMPKRDTLDERIVNNVINGTGRIIDVQGGFPAFTDTSLTKGAWPTLLSRPAAADNDHDGMADEWELQRGLNPANASDRNGISSNGYTHLENYLNGDSIVATGVAGNCVTVPAITATNTNTWLDAKDSSYRRLIATDTTNMVASVKDAGNYGAFNVTYYTTATNRLLNGKVYLNRNVTIVPATPAAITGSVLVRFYFTKAEFDTLQSANSNITSLADLRILRSADITCPTTASAAITEIVPTATSVFGTYENGYYAEFSTTDFGSFFIAGSGTLLPLSLLSFSGIYEGNTVKTTWLTTNEINTATFNVERSGNARDFVSVGTIKALNTAGNHTYNFTDETPLKGISYYRLRTNDLDGKFRYSNVIKVNAESKFKLDIYPDPAKESITITYPNSTINANLQIISSDGKVVLAYKINAGSEQMFVSLASLPTGNYVAVYHDESNKSITKKFIKK